MDLFPGNGWIKYYGYRNARLTTLKRCRYCKRLAPCPSDPNEKFELGSRCWDLPLGLCPACLDTLTE